ncbi:DUF4332 domain-containing protein [Dehalogenimonas etheniformans]|uniref:Uncharacterized protein n=2 Tax=Dehalogenimonas etheniformans TaxID=1536648 RepID=A0A2P5P5I9_9CHLR|nr:hypothetical protein JP09_007365 [Dehalogenimonas etheniformans]QNT75898.1 DUF4332 domain-containing protein [Dehalogenimonas etheniformans]
MMKIAKSVATFDKSERIIVRALVNEEGILCTFADGCTGIIPFREIPEINGLKDVHKVELKTPFEIIINDSIELPWDFVRNFCDTTYRHRSEIIAQEGRESLGERIRSQRKALGLSQAEFAKRAHISRQTEIRIENGQFSPRFSTLQAMAEQLGVSIGNLLTTPIRGTKFVPEMLEHKTANKVTRLSKIECIDPTLAEKLNAVGIKTVEGLLEKGATRTGRKELAEMTMISDALILEWVNRADLFRIKGVGEEFSDLLKAAGVDTVKELAQRKPENLLEKLIEINMQKKLVRRMPFTSAVTDWVKRAQELPWLVEH